MNEVPKKGGGPYCSDKNESDHRDYTKKFDSSVAISRMNLGEVLELLKKHDWLSIDKGSLSREERVRAALPFLKGTRIMQPMEFGRAVHAEMAAMLSAARRGVSIQDSILFTTTFPCHECARHIVGAGILRVVYIEPYPKSLASHLHEDEIGIEETDPNKVSFEPFVGVAPRLYQTIFPMACDRKDADGRYLDWDPSAARPKIAGAPFSYIQNEKESLALLFTAMENAKLNPVEGKKDA